jgi:hypothetical protein
MSHNGEVLRRGRGKREQESSPSAARHVVIAVGDPLQWRSRDPQDWERLLGDLARVAAYENVAAITLVPVVGEAEWHFDLSRVVDGVAISAESRRDGRTRIIEALRDWPIGETVTEETLGRAVRGETGEPDLVIVCGSDERLPPTLVWELAYAELVYVNVTWTQIDGSVLSEALAEFRVRQRRFGGVDESSRT